MKKKTLDKDVRRGRELPAGNSPWNGIFLFCFIPLKHLDDHPRDSFPDETIDDDALKV